MSSSPHGRGSIGLVACLAFAVGTMVGGGVFTLSGTALNEAGPSALVSYLLAGVVMLLSALSFIAVAGRAAPGESSYHPIATILGPTWRFVTMWAFYLNALALLAFLAISFGEYLNEYFVGALGPLAAGMLAVLALTALNLGSTKLVANAEVGVVGVKIAVLIGFVAVGLAHIRDAEFTPFTPNGADGTLDAAAILFTAYLGFNVITNMAEKIKNPERTIPLAVIGSTLIVAVIYIGVVLAMLASGVETFGNAGLSEAAEGLVGDWGGYAIAFAACLSTLSGGNAYLLGASELLRNLASHGEVPSFLARARHGHPFVRVGIIAAIAVPMVLVSEAFLVALANVSALVAMVVVNLAALRLARQRWPGKGMRLVGGPLIPAVALISCLAQFPSLGWNYVVAGLLLVAAGFVFRAGSAPRPHPTPA
jgi:amino acid transporter